MTSRSLGRPPTDQTLPESILLTQNEVYRRVSTVPEDLLFPNRSVVNQRIVVVLCRILSVR